LILNTIFASAAIVKKCKTSFSRVLPRFL